MPLEKLEKAILRGAEEKKLNALVKKALNAHKMQDVVSRLEPHLKHENPNVRLAAMHTLEKTKYYKTEGLIEPLAKDKNARVRSKAREILKRILEDEEII